MKIQGRSAIVTGAGNGIGLAVATELAERGIGAVGLVDRNESVIRAARMINDRMDAPIAEALIGDVTDESFRRKAFDLMCSKHGTPRVCVPAAGITRDRLTIKVDKETGKADMYPIADFRLVCEVNLIAPVYWAMEMVARIAEERKATGRDPLGAGRGNPGHGDLHRIDLAARHPRPNFVLGEQGRARRRGRDAEQGVDVPWGSLRGYPPRVYRYPDGAVTRERIHREKHSALYSVEAFDRTRGDRRCHLLHDLQLGP